MPPSTLALPVSLRDWLATQREQLNGKFRLAQRRYPTLHAETALSLVGEFLPPIAERSDSPELFAALFDLILLHAGRGMLATRTPGLADGSGGRSPALGVLFREAFPPLAPVLAQRPRQLPGALSNAVENLGALGGDFARRLTTLAATIFDPDLLLDAGVILAWRLGDARLRNAALARAEQIAPDLLADLLGLHNWSPKLLPVVVQGLYREGWVRPEALLPEPMRTSPDPGRLLARMDEWDEQVGGGWVLAARLGDFVGFEGAFSEPPVLLEPGEHGTRHRFWVRSAGTIYRLEGDTFGGVCRPDNSGVYPQAPATTDLVVPLPAGTSSVLVRPDLIAWTQANSFRVRVMIRSRSL